MRLSPLWYGQTRSEYFSVKLFLAIAMLAYVLLSAGCGGSAKNDIPIVQTPLPTASIRVAPTSINVSESVTVTWSTANATSIMIDGIGSVADSGTLTLSPHVTTTYHLTASSPAGSAAATDTVTVHNLKPLTIPSLHEWNGASGMFQYSAAARIVNVTSSPDLTDVAQVFSGDVASARGNTLAIVSGQSQPGDISLALGSTDNRLGDEGYCINISDRVDVTAKSAAGVFYATRTLLQMLAQSVQIPEGQICDWPDYPERGLMVDVARAYYTTDWLKSHIRDLAFLKLNTLHLHFTDSEAFRLESTSHPELNSVGPIYSKADITDLIAFATKYRVTIIPEIDLPGHAQIVKLAHPELGLFGVYGSLDVTLPATYSITQDLLNEYIPLFPGPYWHMGSDEYMLSRDQFDTFPQFAQFAQTNFGPTATSFDPFLYFINWTDTQVKAQGKTLRIWGDAWTYRNTTGDAVGLNKDIDVELYNGGNPGGAIAAGYSIIQASSYPLYYVTVDPYTTSSYLYEQWEPNAQWDNFLNPQPGGDQWQVTAEDPKLKAVMFEIWGPTSDTNKVDQDTYALLRSFSQNTWSAEQKKLVTSYSDFTAIVASIGRAPGF